MTTLFNDSRYGVRSLLKRPALIALALAAFITLAAPAPALRTVANAIVFSAEVALTLHPFSFPNQPQLPVLWKYQRALRRLR
jgi:hypothetical protein